MLKEKEAKQFNITKQANIFSNRLIFKQNKAKKMQEKSDINEYNYAYNYTIKFFSSPSFLKFNNLLEEKDEIIYEILKRFEREESHTIYQNTDIELLKKEISNCMDFYLIGDGTDAFEKKYEGSLILNNDIYFDTPLHHYQQLNYSEQEEMLSMFSNTYLEKEINKVCGLKKISYSLIEINKVLLGFDIKENQVTPLGKLAYTLYCMGAGVMEFKHNYKDESIKVITLKTKDNTLFFNCEDDTHKVLEYYGINQLSDFIANYNRDVPKEINKAKIAIEMGSCNFNLYATNNNYESFKNIIDCKKFDIDGSPLNTLSVMKSLNVDIENKESAVINNVHVKKMSRNQSDYFIVLEDSMLLLAQENISSFNIMCQKFYDEVNSLFNRRNSIIKAKPEILEIDIYKEYDTELSRKQLNEQKRINNRICKISIENAVVFEELEIMKNIEEIMNQYCFMFNKLIEKNRNAHNTNFQNISVLDSESFKSILNDEEKRNILFLSDKIVLPNELLLCEELNILDNLVEYGACIEFNISNFVQNVSSQKIECETCRAYVDKK